MQRDTGVRSLVKAVSWRIMGTMATAALVFIFTHKFALALWVGALEFFSKIILFWMHERIWDRVSIGKKVPTPAVLWFTGLSKSGKTAISKQVADDLVKRGVKVEYLNGETVRDIFPDTGFSKPEREEHVKRVGYLASRLEKNGVFVVASFVSPYEDSRRFVQGLCANFVEVHVATPLAECERRDQTGLYARAHRGELHHVAGVDEPYEVPPKPDVTLDISAMTPAEASARVMQRLNHHF
ncbi:MAG: adenylyl-sulfate kinase [Gemmatimonadota bacterium]